MGARDGGRSLTVRQREVLSHLSLCRHSTTNLVRSALDIDRVEGVLERLEARGFVMSTKRGVMGSNRTWTITEPGMLACGFRKFLIDFIGGHRTIVVAATTEEAKRGPWNPSFGIILDVKDVTDDA